MMLVPNRRCEQSEAIQTIMPLDCFAPLATTEATDFQHVALGEVSFRSMQWSRQELINLAVCDIYGLD
jgi:hypothetical protein